MALEAVPGPNWELEHIDSEGVHFEPKGGGVFVFQATLICDTARQTVDFEVTIEAFQSLFSELSNERRKDVRITFALVTELLRGMVVRWLGAGPNRWNPQTRPVVRIPYFFTATREWPTFYLDKPE